MYQSIQSLHGGGTLPLLSPHPCLREFVVNDLITHLFVFFCLFRKNTLCSDTRARSCWRSSLSLRLLPCPKNSLTLKRSRLGSRLVFPPRMQHKGRWCRDQAVQEPTRRSAAAFGVGESRGTDVLAHLWWEGTCWSKVLPVEILHWQKTNPEPFHQWA